MSQWVLYFPKIILVTIELWLWPYGFGNIQKVLKIKSFIDECTANVFLHFFIGT